MNYLDAALKASEGAKRIVMSYYNKEKSIRWKGEIDPVTNADIASEKYIVKKLKSYFPDHSFVTEEEGLLNTGSEYRWIIDPIDGTTSFSHNFPLFSISIALYKKDKPMVGVVNVPYLREVFSAEAGKGAFLNGEKIHVSGIDTMQKALVSTGFPYSRLSSDVDNLKYFNKMAKKVGEIRRTGSAAIDTCYVACGRFDAYWELGLKVMDTAAGLLILTEAGGRFTDFSGKDTADFSQIVASNSILHKQMLDILKEAD
ncbi:MAG: inositol monophosphatase [Nanoarchaeota archaeon]|nr:inositol monophosphatase [Nanoarchaeota archaeon]